MEHPIPDRRGDGHRGSAARDQICLYPARCRRGTSAGLRQCARRAARAGLRSPASFRRPDELVPYAFRGADELICDFFAAVEQACRQEGVTFEFDATDVELEPEDENDAEV